MHLNFEQWFKLLTLLGSIVSFFRAVFVWGETRRLEARRPFLELQLELYKDASKTAALVATLNEPAITDLAGQSLGEGNLDENLSSSQRPRRVDHNDDRELLYREACDRFWLLYWGQLALVEDRKVEAAMKTMGEALKSKPLDSKVIKQCSLDLAHACRASLDWSWRIKEWTTGSTQEKTATRAEKL